MSPKIRPQPAVSTGSARSGGRLSVGAKLAFTTVLVLSVVTIGLFFELSERERARLVSAKADAAAMVTDLFADSLVPLLDFDDTKGIETDLQMLRSNKQVLRAAVWQQDVDEPRAVLGTGSSPLPRKSAAPVIDRESLIVVRPIVTPHQRVLGSTAVEFSLQDENAAYREARTRLLWISALIVSGTMLVLIAVARRLIGRPLQQLADAARRFEAGDYRDPPDLRTGDEIGTLSEAFRAMARATTDREVKLKAATDRVRELFDALRQGVVVVGEDGRIEPGFSRGAPSIFRTSELVGQPIATILYPPVSDPSSIRNTQRLAFAQWVELAFTATPESWPTVVEEAPREATLDGKESQVDLVLEYRALFNTERQLERLIVVATDETATRALERAGIAYKEALETANKRMRAELEASRAEIAAKNRLEKEMEIATQIQTALVPPQPRAVGLEVAARMLTATEVGGDYYDVVPFEQGAWIGVGDVSGHGLTAGIVMLMIQSSLAALFKDTRLTAPRELVVRLNEVLFENVRMRLHQDDHATLTVARYHVDGRLTFAGAHEPIIIVRSGGDVEVIDPPGTWVGAADDVGPFTVDSTIQLRRGDLLVFHTDGVTEARNSDGVLFGLERLVEIARGVASRPVDRVCDAVFDALAAWNDAREDDQTLLVARYNGP